MTLLHGIHVVVVLSCNVLQHRHPGTSVAWVSNYRMYKYHLMQLGEGAETLVVLAELCPIETHSLERSDRSVFDVFISINSCPPGNWELEGKGVTDMG